MVLHLTTMISAEGGILYSASDSRSSWKRVMVSKHIPSPYVREDQWDLSRSPNACHHLPWECLWALWFRLPSPPVRQMVRQCDFRHSTGPPPQWSSKAHGRGSDGEVPMLFMMALKCPWSWEHSKADEYWAHHAIETSAYLDPL